MGLCHSSNKTDVEVNLWVTTGDGIEIGQCGLCVSISASQIHTCCHLLYCGSALRLWIFHGKHLTPCPERYFRVVFFLIETLGLESVTEAWSQPVALRQRIGFMMRRLMTSGGIFSFQSGECLCPPRLINHWAVRRLLSVLERSICGILSSGEMISICAECGQTHNWFLFLIREELGVCGCGGVGGG